MFRTVAALMIMAAPTAFAYTAAELAAKNVTAKGGSGGGRVGSRQDADA
jgi:hypothetical protein